ncbi:hypothetical protein BGX20_007482 [Mortierella sp. AD010]|nr:hypothetical protein BGX20_007482 [Mortierella sp. AD010]
MANKLLSVSSVATSIKIIRSTQRLQESKEDQKRAIRKEKTNENIDTELAFHRKIGRHRNNRVLRQKKNKHT